MLRDDTINRLRFDTLPEMVQYLQTRCAKQSGLTFSSSWYGNTTGAEALRYALSGDDKNVPAALAMLDKFSDELAVHSISDQATVAGAYPVVAEFLAGEPECMRLPTATLAESAPLSVFVDITSSATVTAAEMRTRGIAVLAAVLALSARRPISLEVGCVMGSNASASGLRARERISLVSVVLDTAPLDVATAAFMLSDVAAARRLMYSVAYEAHAFDGGWPAIPGASYGAAQSEPHCARVRELLALPGDTLYLPAVSSTSDGNYAKVFSDPVGWCRSIIAEFGGTLDA